MHERQQYLGRTSGARRARKRIDQKGERKIGEGVFGVVRVDLKTAEGAGQL